MESVASVGRSSFVKTLETFFSTERRLMWHSLRDALVGPAFCHQGQDFALARGQARQAVAVTPFHDQLRHDLRIDRGSTEGDPAYRLHEVSDVANSVLQQVADATGRPGEEPHGELDFDVLRQDEHSELGSLLTQA